MNRTVKTTYPVSYGQKALRFIYQIAPENIAYNIFITVKINSDLNTSTFINVWHKIVERHPILRTTYTTQEGQPLQYINEKHKCNIELTNAFNWSEEELQEKIYAITDRPFNLEEDSVLRVNLFTRSEKEHILLLTMHHIAGDMWSFDLLLSEFQALYNAQIEVSQQQTDFIKNKSYTDFVRWQSEMLSSSRGEELWQYWQKQLAGELPILNLLADKPRPLVQSYQGAGHIIKLDEKLIQKLSELALASRTSLYKILLTAFYVLLYRYTDQKDILIGSPMRGRWSGDFLQTVGYFVNLTVLRTAVEENATFTEFLAQVTKTVKAAQEHQDYPFSLLAEQLQPHRDPSRSPLCQVSFTWQRQRWCEPTDNSFHSQEQVLEMMPYLLGHQRGADFDLNLIGMEAQGVLQLCWQYNTDLFEATTITRMAGHFVTLLEGIVANPDRQISLLPLLTSVEQRQLLIEWNDTGADYTSCKCIHQLFEEQVAQTPDNIAVVYDNQELTYRELNNRANQLAHYLQSKGVGADVLVGICVERSLEMIIGMLGVLKAGGAYVPIDPNYPIERVSFMLEDSQVSFLLTQERLIESLPEHQTQFICLDTDWQDISHGCDLNLTNSITAENLAYIIYTSGSTGKPKGVMIEHQSLVNFTQAAIAEYGLSANERMLQFFSISFDGALAEIYSTLTCGGTLVLRTEEMLSSVRMFIQKCQEWDINAVFLPTAYWHELTFELVNGNLQLPPSLRLVNIGGEQLIEQRLRMWQDYVGEYPELTNGYGPTEATIAVTICKCPGSATTELNQPKASIGKPIENVQTYILDTHLQPVPIGVPGELHIGGVCLSRGYLNRPDLTEEKFIANPFQISRGSQEHGSTGGKRLYKTGDLARYLPNGDIEYLGRIDNQVKIRGFRIELGEIETALNQFSQIQASTVIVREDTPGDKRLVAYILPTKEVRPTVNEIRQFIKAKLPEYMIPSAFVMLEFLPLTPSGKIDRRALPAPDLNSQLSDKYVAPQTHHEEMLSQIWAQVLKIEQVGIYDNFFELGGHSLLATQLISRIRNIFKVELPLRRILAAPTVAELAQEIGQLQQGDLEITAPPISPRARDAELRLSFAQQRLWFLDQFGTNNALYNIPMALRLVGTVEVAALEQSLQTIIGRHEALRTNFIAVDGKPRQVIHTSANWKLSIVELQHLPQCEQEISLQQLGSRTATQPFDLASESLIRATLVVLSPTEYTLIVCIHHIVSDGWSTGVFVEELATLYHGYLNGQSSPLAPLPIQYADFALWQREWFAGDLLESQLSYWTQQLQDAPELLSLATDRPRPAVQTFRGAHLEFALSEKLTSRLIQLSTQQGVTLFMTLLAAFDTLLYRYTGDEDILVGTLIAGRDRSEIESLIGFFVNTLVMRADVSGDPSFNELLIRIRDVTMDGYAHQNLPFEMLVEALQPQRDLSYTPLFQVMFILQNAPVSQVKLSDLNITAAPIETATAKFDLTLAMENTATGLVGVWEYNTDLFDRSTIERMSGHFVTMLEGIVANPDQQISLLPMLTSVEQRQLLIEWNDTGADYPQNKCIHQLFESQVERTPHKVAVVFENQQLTYTQLNSRANQLAQYLRSLGVKPSVLVGLCVERSVEMIVGILGILKAGGAYVPLDPEYPHERLNFMVEDAQVKLLLTQQHLVERLPKYKADFVYLDTEYQESTQASEVPNSCEVNSSNLAYVLYTSGSTGRPKAVAIEHHSPVALVSWAQEVFTPNELAGVLASTSICFDLSVFELFVPLSVGGKVILAENALDLSTLVSANQVTLINTVPSAIAELIRENNLPQQVCTVNLAGEPLQNQLVQQIYQHSQVERVFNLYGPSEDTTYSTFSFIEKGSTSSATIGRAIANTQIYILDKYLQPVPIGVPGELHIGGEGLARGYLKRPELTQQKFISNPFESGVSPNKSRSRRLYKTGDLARYLPDGNIEYLGRIDNQVKIRGYRIELGEIEAILNQHGNVRTSCAIAREDSPGEKRLVAYVVPSETTPKISELRQFLTGKLPDYMIPNAIVILEALPLTPNGKINRRALPKPELNSELKDKYVAPRTPTEEMVASIWAQVLKLEQVGINDNFFTLGGHSLLATQVVSRIRKIFQVELPLRNLFTAPTVSKLANLIEHLGSPNLESTPPILARAQNTELPLSFAQQRLWFLDQLKTNSALYNIPMILRIVGFVQVGVLEQSIRGIIARHGVLRTNFIAVDGQPRQIIHSSIESTWAISVVDLQHLSTTEQEIASRKVWQQQATLPFDLASESLIRATLVVLSPTECTLIVCMHHIVSDGWSTGVFVEELATLYHGYSNGQPSPLAPLPVQYADFALWQREWFVGDVLESQLSYWTQQLQDAPELLSLATDRPRPTVQTFRGAHLEFALSEKLTSGLMQLSTQQGVTLFMTLLAAFDTLLYRYTGDEDILVGTLIAGRDRSEIESLIGFFVNTLVMRADVSGDPSFNELLIRIRDLTMDGYAHQNLPFEMLVEALQPQRDLSYTPLFQVMFVLQNAPVSKVKLSDLSITASSIAAPIETATAKFDLTLVMENTATGLVGVWEYNTDLFDRSTIERMTGHFVTLLEGIVANPDQQISLLPMLTSVEQRQLLIEWNDTGVDYPQDKCIHQLFESQVERTPDKVAVVFENQKLTYTQLNNRANQLAHYLRSLGVKPSVLVGLCVERSVEMIVGILGILKAGGAYVPLDPEYPHERLNFMVEDAQVKLLLTQEHLVESLPQNQAHTICLDSEWELISQWSQNNPITDVLSTNLAYVIYTSGTTGQPKGVMLPHSNLCNHMYWMQATFPLTEEDKVLQKTPFGFDASVWEFYAPLLAGGQLVMAQPKGHTDPAYLIRLIILEQITTVQLVPSLLQMLLEQGGIENCHSLKHVFCGGEVLPVALVEGLLSKLAVNLHNLYGPTETCIDATSWNCDRQMCGEVVPIGRPIANTEVYILDKLCQPVPVGVPGELHIGGAGVARGYLNRPELTQQKFISNPFGSGVGTRKLYKTGDLARYLPSGNIEYLGRIDNQVKIRGLRIELGEIEAVLNQHSDVQACCVIARADALGNKCLVAYIVPYGHCTPITGELRQFLKTKVPEYMVPQAFVMLESLPLTPNGKVDRRALPAPDLNSEQREKYVAPRTPTEEMLTSIWAQLLKVERVGIDDNFFELGGHSLLATQLVSRIRNIFKVELPLRSVFAEATVEELTQEIRQLQQGDLELSAPPILPRAEDVELPLSFAQQRLWFLDQFGTNNALYNIPMALRLVGTVEVAALELCLQTIIGRHEALRTNFIAVDGKPKQVIHTSANWKLSIVELQHLPQPEQEISLQQLGSRTATQPFDLASESLIRATLVVLSPTEYTLIVCIHHIVSDGWSTDVFVQELAALYNAYGNGQPSPLTPLPIQYADFALWQREWFIGDVLESQLSYWTQQLQNTPALLSLPTDRPRPNVQTFQGAHFEFALSEELTNSLIKLSQKQGVTLFMMLLAAFDTLLYRYTDVADILVGSPIANRNHSEIEGLIGFFVNTLVMRTDLSGNPSFNELLARVRSMAMDAYAHQDLPFEMLVEALQPQRDLSYTPLFQVNFILQNAPLLEVELSGLTVSSLLIDSGTAKFDLNLAMINTGTGLVGVWEYNTDLFDRSTIERMSGHLTTLLEGIVANPQERIDQLPLLTSVEKQQLLIDWNNTKANYSSDKCIHQLFEEQVEQTPDAIAVVFENQQLTYTQLNIRANQLAHYLRSLGVKPSVLVGLCVERSVEMIVGILGILKAGGAYVPLDPEYPHERLSNTIEDAQIKVLLTQEQLVNRLSQHNAQLVCYDTERQKIASHSQSNPINTATASDYAYVIYTSGSTGKPKGVLVKHSNVVRLFAATNSWYNFNSEDTLTLFHSYAFDFSVWEMWGALLHGGRLVVVPYLVTRSPELFYNLLCEKKVTILNQTPSAFRQLIQAEQSIANAEDLKLRLVIFGGEALEINSLQPWFERHGDEQPQLVNMYGITETTVHVTYRPLSKADLNGTASVIGRPIPDLRVYVLDKHLQPVPIGVPGEMYVGGAGVSGGYLNRAELTKERFIGNPFEEVQGSKLYKTGDLARYLPNGELEYLGRIDQQVKIRGFRIELGEIESLLTQHQDVGESVVVVREDEQEDKRLVAYLVPKAEVFPTVVELRQYLEAKLPNYMVPNAFVILESLPLTSNGKIDRRALPGPDLTEGIQEFVAPRTPTEEMLATIWAEVLKVEKVGINDNFFELGGHSLLATQLVSRIRKTFQIELPLRELFSAATVAQLADCIEQLKQQNSELTVPRILPRIRKRGRTK